MKRALAAALCTVVLIACRDQAPTTPFNYDPSASISDGAHESGNPDFFFLPPMVPNPSSHADFDAGAFNASLSPEVQICEGTGATGTECDGVEIVVFTMTTGSGSETVRVSALDEHYIVNFHTNNFPLNPALTYRIRVLIGSTLLGHADVELGATRGELKNVNTNLFIPLLDGRTLPIKFRIENEALCDPPGSTCSSETVDLGDDQPDDIVLATGDGIHIEPQANGQVHTITVQECVESGAVEVDLPRFGRCLTITADPPIDENSAAPPLDPPATISICNADFEVHAAIAAGNLTEEQEPLVTLHRQHGETIQALPHARDFCPVGLGSLPASGPKGLAQAGWNLVRRGLTAAFAPRRLYASLVVLDEGGGGESGFISDFQFALPAQMDPIAGTSEQTGSPGEPVENPPGVVVTDQHGDAVTGATVHFAVTAGNGTVTPMAVVSNADGIAQVTSWTLGDAGDNTVRAFGRGIADPGDEGTFMPDISLPTSEQTPVLVETGEVFFNAEAVVAQLVSPVSSSLQMVASSNANGIVVEDTDGGSQTGTLNPLSAEVSARAVSEGTDILTSGSATATWTDAGNGQVVFTGVGWAIAQNTGLNSHAHLTAGNDWTYTFVAVQSGTFTLQFNVTQDAGTTNNFGLNGFNFRWTPSGGSSQSQFMWLGTTGTITNTVVAGTTYTVQVDNQANVFFSGGFGTPTAHMSGTFNWSIAAPIL